MKDIGKINIQQYSHKFLQETSLNLDYMVNITATDVLATAGPGHQKPWYWPSSS